MEKIYKITLRLSTAATISPLFSAVQGDTDTRKIQATLLTDEGTAFTPGSGVTAEYWSQKPDGTGTQHSAALSSNVVTVTLSDQDLAAPGRVYAAIVLKKGTEVLAAMPFWFTVAPIPMGKDIESTDDYQMLMEAVEAASHGPYIREDDLHWMVWDQETRAYADSNVPASGAETGAVLFVKQTLTAKQKVQARTNIDAACDTDIRAGTYETRALHLGFYLDSNGYLCQG